MKKYMYICLMIGMSNDLMSLINYCVVNLIGILPLFGYSSFYFRLVSIIRCFIYEIMYKIHLLVLIYFWFQAFYFFMLYQILVVLLIKNRPVPFAVVVVVTSLTKLAFFSIVFFFMMKVKRVLLKNHKRKQNRTKQ